MGGVGGVGGGVCGNNGGVGGGGEGNGRMSTGQLLNNDHQLTRTNTSQKWTSRKSVS